MDIENKPNLEEIERLYGPWPIPEEKIKEPDHREFLRKSGCFKVTFSDGRVEYDINSHSPTLAKTKEEKKRES